ncbi:MAG: hypothetical protein MSG64_05545 [Pyrinomonadaceae bacterium MAG19_C2-C3]|nr:hypothetical protein [Pyrinomonadaceae bacterium MAG19_C2-C3]
MINLRASKIITIVIVFVLVCVHLVPTVNAAVGDIDLAFGTSGKQIVNFAGSTDLASAVAVQKDGKVIVVGTITDIAGDFAVARYNANGSPDLSFGNGGKVVTDFGGLDRASAVGVQADGKILVAGSATGQTEIMIDGIRVLSSSLNFAVARYNPDGTLDATFDRDGRAMIDFAGGSDEARAVLLQPDGKITLVGTAGRPLPGQRFGIQFTSDFGIARFNSDGTLDTSFGIAGKTGFNVFDRPVQVNAAALQADGRILIVSRSGFTGPILGPVEGDFILARFNLDGTLDTTFGDAGKVVTDFDNGNDNARAVAVQSDGRIVVAGATFKSGAVGDTDFAVARYTGDGRLDTDFDLDGRATIDFGKFDTAQAIVLQTDGRIILAGASRADAGFGIDAGFVSITGVSSDFALARLNSDGTLDAAYGDAGGRVTTNLNGTQDYAVGVSLTANGNLIAVGATVSFGTALDFALVSYDANGRINNGFGVNGKQSTNFGGGNDRAESVAAQADGKLVVAGTTAYGATGDDFAVTRINTDGTLDNTFGAGGRVVTDFSGFDGYDTASATLVQTDGRIVVIGTATNFRVSQSDFALARYHTDGSPDLSFGDAGKVITDFGEFSFDRASDAVLQPDGKIVVVGSVSNPTGENGYNVFGIARYNADGNLDTTFGGGDGLATTGFGEYALATSIAVQTDGRIIVAGLTAISINFFPAQDFAVARYTATGELDTSFGTNGRVTTDFDNGSDYAGDVAVQDDGSIIVVGANHPLFSASPTFSTSPNGGVIGGRFTSFGIGGIALARYDASGKLDSSFDADGKATTNLRGIGYASAVSLQPDKRIIVSGNAFGRFPLTGDLSAPGDGLSFAGSDFALARFLPDGSLDPSFGTNGGVITTDFAQGNDASADCLLLPDNRLTVVGYAGIRGNSFDFAIARYSLDGLTLGIGDITVRESTRGTQTAIVTVALSAPSTETVTVNYTTADGTARAGSDYAATSGTLTFVPGSIKQTIAVPVLADTLRERDELFSLRLSDVRNGAAYRLVRADSQVTIINAVEKRRVTARPRGR